MHPNAQLIETFYQNFQKRNAAGMTACYAENIEFNDAAFGTLQGRKASAMWEMLMEIGDPGLKLVYSGVEADDKHGKAHWEATYKFAKTGRTVHNIIDAEFTFQNGKIVVHHDTFDFYRWMRMALGPIGLLLGWAPFFQKALRKQVQQQFERWVAKKGIQS